MNHNCPSCQKVLYNRRLTHCGFCGAQIPDSLRFTAEEIAALDQRMAELEEQRGQREQAAAKEKEEARQRGRETLLVVLMVALTFSGPRIVFGYFPQLGTGWTRFAVVIGIPLLILFPFSFLMQRLKRKGNHDASYEGS
jgi:hypothetical protein